MTPSSRQSGPVRQAECEQQQRGERMLRDQVGDDCHEDVIKLVTRLLRSGGKGSGGVALERDRALIFLHIDTGLTAVAMMAMQVSDLDLDASTARTAGSTHSFGPLTHRAFAQYLPERAKWAFPEVSALWISAAGGPLAPEEGLHFRIYMRAQQANLSPAGRHLLRSTFRGRKFGYDDPLRALRDAGWRLPTIELGGRAEATAEPSTVPEVTAPPAPPPSVALPTVRMNVEREPLSLASQPPMRRLGLGLNRDAAQAAGRELRGMAFFDLTADDRRRMVKYRSRSFENDDVIAGHLGIPPEQVRAVLNEQVADGPEPEVEPVVPPVEAPVEPEPPPEPPPESPPVPVADSDDNALNAARERALGAEGRELGGTPYRALSAREQRDLERFAEAGDSDTVIAALLGMPPQQVADVRPKPKGASKQ